MEAEREPGLYVKKVNKVYLVSLTGRFRAGIDPIMFSLRAVSCYISEEVPGQILLKPSLLILPEEESEELMRTTSLKVEKTFERMRIMGRILSEL